jgi:inhibitor of cysteine peptidase
MGCVHLKSNKKIFKIIAMLLVVSAVVFAAGCSSKNNNTQPALANENITQSTAPAEITADNSTTDINATDENVTDFNVTGISATPVPDNSTT